MGDRHTIVNGTVTLTSADTEYELPIPVDATEIVARLAVASTWRWSATAGVVAAGAGFPLASGEDLAFDGAIKEQTLYIANDAAGGTLHYSWCVPYRTRP